MALVYWIVSCQIFRINGLARNAPVAGDPLPQVDEAAAFAAEWTPLLALSPLYRPLTGRTFDGRLYITQHNSSNSTCSSVCTGRSSARS